MFSSRGVYYSWGWIDSEKVKGFQFRVCFESSDSVRKYFFFYDQKVLKVQRDLDFQVKFSLDWVYKVILDIWLR